MRTMVMHLLGFFGLGLLLAWGTPAGAHCDTLDGPVVADARVALAKGDVTPTLKWVRATDEAEIRAAFQQALKVRGLSADAKALADTYFFETLVRIHRAGEGAPYTGLKPAGSPVEPGIALADDALKTGNAEKLVAAITTEVANGIRKRFTHAAEAKKHAGDSVADGREYVAAYVTFIHFVEGLHTAMSGTSHAAEGAHDAEEAAHADAAPLACGGCAR
ncbi:MAG: hypothetical protein BWY76_00180 [bacterium ADurb.Bin429]|nr:MAG: hypothetical protein BWY76_00180 [bacterium ADurb.Bin429]